MDTHELAAIIFAHNVDKGIHWAFEQAETFLEESDRRESEYWDKYDEEVDESFDSILSPEEDEE